MEPKFKYIFKEKYSEKLHHREFTLRELEYFEMDLFLLEKNWQIVARRQSTGHKDINGNEIYDGDTVNIKTLVKKGDLVSDCLATIGWSQEHCSWELDFISPKSGKRGMSSPCDTEKVFLGYKIITEEETVFEDYQYSKTQ